MRVEQRSDHSFELLFAASVPVGSRRQSKYQYLLTACEPYETIAFKAQLLAIAIFGHKFHIVLQGQTVWNAETTWTHGENVLKTSDWKNVLSWYRVI